jgi:hypothetical protein
VGWKKDGARIPFGCPTVASPGDPAYDSPCPRNDFRLGKTLIMEKTSICYLIFLTAIFTFFLNSRAPLAFAGQAAPSTYQPKFRGDPARSDSEAAALAYMRVVIRAQQQFNKQYGHYATTLAELVHSGSFTKRMVDPDRGDYHVSFKGKKDSYVLTMTPNHLDGEHRSFYAEDDGKIHADEEKPADDKSPVVK